jgi:nucleotide-binding universal stress UspA family protein
MVMARIVVGVDGSEESMTALRWAVEEARLRGASVEAVHVHDPLLPVYGMDPGVPMSMGVDDIAREAESQARRLVEEMVEALEELGGVPVRAVVVEAPVPARALVERSADADMLVVSSRGRGGFQELLLGSVSHQCATHAECPVVILRRQGHAG